MNQLLDVLAFGHDDRPSLLVTCNEYSGAPGSVAHNTTTDVEFSDGSGTFNDSPTVNVGGWAAGTGGNEEIIVPETGLYLVTIHGQWGNNSTGYRIVQMTDATSAVGQLKLAANAVNGHGTFMSGSVLWFFTASDLLGMSVFQNCTTDLSGVFTLSATWVNSSTS